MTTQTQPILKRQIDWVNTLTIILFHAFAVVAVAYIAMGKCSPWTFGLAVAWFVFSGLAITGGYHRLFSHRSFEAHWTVRSWFLLFAAAAVQNSALRWCADHRRHHSHTDRPEDPYDATKGFWWSHIGWIMCKPPKRTDPALVKDLAADPLVAIQDRFYVPFAFLMGAVVPGLIGLIWGDPIGGILVAGFLRLVVQWHATFSINSVAHILGSQPFSTRNSSRDSIWTAILTMGEGYHNYHHTFQCDYRNGIKWHHYDPTKWLVWTFDKVGLANNLRRVSDKVIESRRAKVIEEARVRNSAEKTVTLPASDSVFAADQMAESVAAADAEPVRLS